MKNKKFYNVKFYIDQVGNEKVRAFLMKLSEEDRKVVARDIKALQLKWSSPHTIARPLGNNRWEIKTNLKDKIVLIMFCIHDENIILMHASTKLLHT